MTKWQMREAELGRAMAQLISARGEIGEAMVCLTEQARRVIPAQELARRRRQGLWPCVEMD